MRRALRSAVSRTAVSQLSRRTLRFYASARPENVGIAGIDVYFPRQYVKQEQLEEFDKAGKGKYTIGLGQRNMAFVDDREDISSMAMTAVNNLLTKYKIDPRDIGRLEVGTETIIDKSKSVKSALMNLFKASGNTSIEGIDTTNACYGGTNALLNSVNWIESSAWDGRHAIVVAGDIAVYEPGPARPTGGAGVVAMLISKDAPLAFETGLRHSYMEDAYDFYKPNLESEYPIVDGKLSITCYLRALDSCYRGYREKFARRFGREFDLSQTDYSLYHSPFTKLVMRSYARMMYNDFLASKSADGIYKDLAKFRALTDEQSYTDKDLTKVLDQISKSGYERQTAVSQIMSQELGNTYCGSLYCNLSSLISNAPEQVANGSNKRLLLFSYGSGLAATLFSLKVRGSIQHMADTLNLKKRLAERVSVAPEVFTKALLIREGSHSAGNYSPVGDTTPLFPGSFYLKNIDKLKRRSYAQAP